MCAHNVITKERKVVFFKVQMFKFNNIQYGPKNKPLPNFRKLVLNRVEHADVIRLIRQIKV